MVVKEPTEPSLENHDCGVDGQMDRMTGEDTGCPLGKVPILSSMESGPNPRMEGNPLSSLPGLTVLELSWERRARQRRLILSPTPRNHIDTILDT